MHYDYLLHCRVEFGQYCQVHEDKDRKNSVELERTTGAIALKSSGNIQGGYRFMSLKTGRVLTRQHSTVCPITTQVIERVHQLANQDGVLTDEEEFLHGSLEEVTPTKEEQDPTEAEKVVPSNEEMPELYSEEPE